MDKKIQRIEEDIRLTNNLMLVLEYRRTIFNETQKVYLEFPDDENTLNYLLQAYAEIAIAAIQAGDYDASISAITKLIELDKNDICTGFVPLVLVNAYVLQGSPEKAWPIYKKYKDKMMPNSTVTYRDSFLTDIRELEQKGIHHEEFIKIKQFLME